MQSLFWIILIMILILAILVLWFWLKKFMRGGRRSGFEERREKFLEYMKTHNKITNDEYQKLTNVSDSMATYDLDELEKEGLIQQIGEERRNTYYKKVF